MVKKYLDAAYKYEQVRFNRETSIRSSKLGLVEGQTTEEGIQQANEYYINQVTALILRLEELAFTEQRKEVLSRAKHYFGYQQILDKVSTTRLTRN